MLDGLDDIPGIPQGLMIALLVAIMGVGGSIVAVLDIGDGGAVSSGLLLETGAPNFLLLETGGAEVLLLEDA